MANDEASAKSTSNAATPIRRIPRRPLSGARLATMTAAAVAASTLVLPVSEAFTPTRKRAASSTNNNSPSRAALVTPPGGPQDNGKRGKTTRAKTPQKTNTPRSPKKVKRAVNPTTSFEPLVAATCAQLSSEEKETPLHTLILGTHPSQESLKQGKYYGLQMNAFWWIVGDCLGFRRDTGISPSTGKTYKFTDSLRPEYAQNILTYDDQVACLLRHGFGLWDIVGSCKRPGSLDKDITEAQPNQIRELAAQYPSLKRIVISNGGLAATTFVKSFPDWCQSGELQANNDEMSQKVLGKKLKGSTDAPITVVVAMSPSPAAASASYATKRDFWERHVFEPGKRDHQAHQVAK